jgi:hypothetical protein
MGKKEDELVAEAEKLIKKFEENHAMGIQIKKEIKEKLKSGWEDGAPILSERKKKLKRLLMQIDVLVGDDDSPDEHDHMH